MATIKYTPLNNSGYGYIRRDDGSWAYVELDDQDLKRKSEEDEKELYDLAKKAIEGHKVKAHPMLQKTTDKLIKGNGKMAKAVEKYTGYKTKWGK